MHSSACGYRPNVMNVNKPLAEIAILLAEQQVTDGASISEESDTIATCSGITFVSVHNDLLSSSLFIGVGLV